MIRFGSIEVVLLLSLLGITPVYSQIVPAFPVNPDTVYRQDGPDITVDDEGNFMVVWGSDNKIYLAIYDSLGNTLREPYSIYSSPGFWGSVASPKIVTSGDYVIVVWNASYIDPGSENNANGLLLTRDGDLVGADGGELLFAGLFRYGDYAPQVAWIDDSTFCVVWISARFGTPSDFDIYGQLITNSLRLIGDLRLINDHTAPDAVHASPRIATSPATKHGIIVWWDDRTGQRQVYGRRLDQAGMPQDTSFFISDLPGHSDVWFLAVAMDTTGNFIVTWDGQVDSVYSIFLRRYASDGTSLGQEVKVNDTADLGDIYSVVDISIDVDGTFIAVWVELINGAYSTRAQRFTADGIKLGPNFFITSPDTVRQLFPSVALSHGKIYITWERYDPVMRTHQVWASVLDFNDPLSITAQERALPRQFHLYPNYPNPFNSSTLLSFDLANRYPTLVFSIYDILGRPVRVFSFRNMMPGMHTLFWDGKDDGGQALPSGVYLFQLAAPQQAHTRKMVLIK